MQELNLIQAQLGSSPSNLENLSTAGSIIMKKLKDALGQNNTEAVLTLLEQTVAGSLKSLTNREQRVKAVCTMLSEMSPSDPAEAMLAAQMISVHFQAIELMQQASSCVLAESKQLYINLAARLMRTFTRQMDTFRKNRLKGRQEIRVEHISINGGQNILGTIANQPGGRG